MAFERWQQLIDALKGGLLQSDQQGEDVGGIVPKVNEGAKIPSSGQIVNEWMRVDREDTDD